MIVREIETARLRLRPFRPEDAADLHAQVYGDADAMRYIADGTPRTLEETARIVQRFMEHGEQYGYTIWAVEKKTGNQFIGQCGLIHIQQTPDVELAYAYGKTHWGQGYATEAARACVRYAFEVVHLDVLIAIAYPQNAPSQNVMRKLGMQYQGIDNRYYDTDLAIHILQRASYRPDESLYTLRD